MNGLQVPAEKEAALLFPTTGLRMQEEVVLLSEDVSLENQEMEAEAAPLGDETELVKSLAELDSHMEQVNTVPGNYLRVHKRENFLNSLLFLHSICVNIKIL